LEPGSNFLLPRCSICSRACGIGDILENKDILERLDKAEH